MLDLRTDRGSLRLRTATIGYRAVLSVAGAVNPWNVEELRRALDALLEAGERELWIDLTAVTFLERSAIGALAAVSAQLERDHRRLALIAPPGPALRSLQLARADGAFRIFADRAGAHRAS